VAGQQLVAKLAIHRQLVFGPNRCQLPTVSSTLLQQPMCVQAGLRRICWLPRSLVEAVCEGLIANDKVLTAQIIVSACTQHSTAQHSTAQHSTAQHSTVQYSTVQYSTVQYSTSHHTTAQHCHRKSRLPSVCLGIAGTTSRRVGRPLNGT
jgi:hypothetical protein